MLTTRTYEFLENAIKFLVIMLVIYPATVLGSLVLWRLVVGVDAQ